MTLWAVSRHSNNFITFRAIWSDCFFHSKGSTGTNVFKARSFNTLSSLSDCSLCPYARGWNFFGSSNIVNDTLELNYYML